MSENRSQAALGDNTECMPQLGGTRVARHRTAITRVQLSRPVWMALEASLITRETTFLDYGCGHGYDLRELRARGIECFGWDPVYRASGKRCDADVVNLGYVVNVIEDPEERVQTLRTAWNYARSLLVVAARLTVEVKQDYHRQFADGCLTRTGTFQKFFTQQELRDWIDQTLNVQSIAVAPGVFFVFRDEALRRSFVASQYRRRTIAPRVGRSEVLFERNRALLEPLMQFVADRGRLPDQTELREAENIRSALGSLKRAFIVIKRVTGNDQWDKIRGERSQDLLIYLALDRFGGRPQFSRLPRDLQLDVKAFFGAYSRACEAADQLLFSAGDIQAVDQACSNAPCGKLTRDALYIHVSALPSMPPILRVYEGCARRYIGMVREANIIKLHRFKPKVSYLLYPGFDKDPHPQLFGALVVPLQDFDVKYWNWSDSVNPPILHRKEEFVSSKYPHRVKFERLTRQEERWGLFENSQGIGTQQPWQELLTAKRLRLSGHRLVSLRQGAARR